MLLSPTAISLERGTVILDLFRTSRTTHKQANRLTGWLQRSDQGISILDT